MTGLVKRLREHSKDREAADEIERLKKQRRRLLAACKWTLNWLSSFSMPPTSTIQEKQQAMEYLERVIEAAEKGGER